MSAAPRNRLAFVALAFALAGFLCLPVIGSIAGVLLGFIARRRPARRGVALAAIVLGVAAPLLFWPLVVVGAIRLRTFMQSQRMLAGGVEVLAHADEFHADYGRWPVDEVECFGAELPPFDAWGTPMSLRITGDGDFARREVWSAGRDRAWNTGDDTLIVTMPRRVAP